MQLIDEEEWLGLPLDVKGAIYEELLERKDLTSEDKQRILRDNAAALYRV